MSEDRPTLLAIQHAPWEGPHRILDACGALHVRTVKPLAGQPLPPHEEVAGAVVMVIVSLFTAPKPAAELAGLVYGTRSPGMTEAPAPGDEEHADVAIQAFEVIAAALAGYRLEGAALIHAVRMWRAACHGIATLQTAGGFGLPESVDVTFGYLVDALDAEFYQLGVIG